MNVDFNNVRKAALSNFNHLVDVLNAGICNGRYINVSTESITPSLDNLRSCLVGIACTYNEGDPEFVCVLGEDDHVKEFNPERDHKNAHSGGSGHSC